MDFDRVINWHGRRPWHGYVFAIAITVAALVIREVFFAKILLLDVPFLFFFISTILAAWYGGMGPGLLASFLGGVFSAWYYIKIDILLHNPAAQIKLLLFMLAGILFSVLFESLHFNRKRLMYKRQLLEMEVAQRHRAQEELVEADRRKNQFLATLGHELRSPLGAISNALHLLEDADDEKVRASALTIMRRQAGHMKKLIDDLLDTARVSENKLVITRQPMPLGEALRNALDAARPAIEARGHHVHLNMPELPLWVDGDMTRLTQVFLNILANSAKYTEPKGHIYVTARREAGQAIVSIRDNGIGIAPGVLPKIFDLYVQAESTLTQSQGGLGIGLSLVRRLVVLHGGTVTAQSEGVGKGSEFIVRIPLSSHTPAAAAAARKTQDGPARKHCILVVDDNEASAQTLAWMMEAMGHQVKMANDGATALRIAPAFHPDVVLLDLGMPDIDGYEICRRMRKLPGFDAVKIIAQTGWGTPEQQQLSKEAGFDAHLIKPVDVAVLEKVLESVTTSCNPSGP